MSKITFPDDSKHIAILGMNGSGKTVAGLWLLSNRSYDRRPWIIFDFKRDENIAKIPGLVEIDGRQGVPKRPGIYVFRPFPDEKDRVENLLWAIWEAENCGVFIDEGYMIDRFSHGLKALLTQGRSKRTPVIMLSQRPSWINPFLLSESSYLWMFFLHNPADMKTMREWIPYSQMVPKDYTSLYYDVSNAKLTQFNPVPNIPHIMQTFKMRMPKRTVRIFG